MRSPREAAGNAVECDGSEGWAGGYLYPNEWSLTCHKKVAIVDPDASWSMHRVDENGGWAWVWVGVAVVVACNWAGVWV